MKQIISVFVLLLFAIPASAQTYYNNAPNPVANGIGNAFSPNTVPTTMPVIQSQGVHIKTLEERQQDRMAEQNQRMRDAGIDIRQIQNPQQNNVLNIQPDGNVQQMGRQYQDNRNVQGLQPNGAPASQGNYGIMPQR